VSALQALEATLTTAVVHCAQVLELPPIFDLSMKQKATASLTARPASRKPQLAPDWFCGPGRGLQRASVGPAHFAQRAAAMLGDNAAFKFLSRCRQTND